MSQTNAQLLADSLGTASTGTVPIGGIILWSGSTASIPNGYVLCNGSNGTPNLRNRFVVGAGSGYAVDATGGSANAVVVSHNHGVSNDSHSHGVTDPGHFHSTESNNSTGGNYSGGGSSSNLGPYYPTNTGSKTTGVTVNSASTGITINNRGVSGTNANLPPYYALAYIMRTS